ncbi:MAG: short-chain dehydrogenase [Acidobacteria bacterium]|nr:MAG: short-chain dehydrogenase [Acidobacteriota bacterium]
MDLGLADQSVLLVGASRGIGLAGAKAFAAEGCRTALMARDAEGLRSAAREAGAALAVAGDATREEDAARAVRETLERLGRIDVLVNLVGGSRGDPGIAAPDSDWDAVLASNLRAAVRMTRLVEPGMRERGSGAIINVSSIFGREWGGAVSYNAAKAALIAYTKSCARDLAPAGVRVNSVAPGSVLFPGGSWDRRRRADPEGIDGFVKRELPLGRFGRPEEVAAAIVFLASPRASLITGACLSVDGGQSRSLF